MHVSNFKQLLPIPSPLQTAAKYTIIGLGMYTACKIDPVLGIASSTLAILVIWASKQKLPCEPLNRAQIYAWQAEKKVTKLC